MIFDEISLLQVKNIRECSLKICSTKCFHENYEFSNVFFFFYRSVEAIQSLHFKSKLPFLVFVVVQNTIFSRHVLLSFECFLCASKQNLTLSLILWFSSKVFKICWIAFVLILTNQRFRQTTSPLCFQKSSDKGLSKMWFLFFTFALFRVIWREGEFSPNG